MTCQDNFILPEEVLENIESMKAGQQVYLMTKAYVQSAERRRVLEWIQVLY